MRSHNIFAPIASTVALSTCLLMAYGTQSEGRGQGDAQKDWQSRPSHRVLVPAERTERAKITVRASGSAGYDEYTDDIGVTLWALEQYWSKTLPGRFSKPYTRPAGFYAYNPDQGGGLPCNGKKPAARNAFYCSENDTIQWDEPNLMRPFYQLGDFAVSFVLAHEWGHAMQARMGVLGPGRPNIQKELQADCFAGAWAQFAQNTLKIVEDGDLDEAMEALLKVKDPVGMPWLDPRAHGSGHQRIQAFNAGFVSGDRACTQ